MPHIVPQLHIEDIAEPDIAISFFGGQAGPDTLDISMVDIVIALVNKA